MPRTPEAKSRFEFGAGLLFVVIATLGKLAEAQYPGFSLGGAIEFGYGAALALLLVSQVK